MQEENQVYFVDSDQLPPAALERKHRLEQDPSFQDRSPSSAACAVPDPDTV